MEVLKKFIRHFVSYYTRCPQCESTNITQIEFHDTHGVNGYICNNCGCRFGN